MEIDVSLFLSNDQSTISTRLLQTVVDNIVTGIEVLKAVRKDNAIIDFEYILANETARKRAGTTKLVGKKFLQPDTDKYLFSRMAEVVETGTSFQILVTGSVYGSPRWYMHKYVQFGDGVIVYVDDISEKKLSEQSAIESQEFIENIADSTPGILYVLDLEARTIIYMNRPGYEMLGLTEAEVREKGHDIFFQLIHPDDYVKRMNHYTQIGADPSDRIMEIDVRKKMKDGGYHWFRVRDKVFRRNNDGMAISIIGIATDVQQETESAINLVNQEEQYSGLLKEQSHYLQRIQETVPDMISITNLATREFEYLNKETFKRHGFDPDIMQTKSLEERMEIIHADDRQVIADYFQKSATIADDEIITAEYRAKDDNGEWKWFLVRGRPFQRNEKNEVTHLLNVIEHITERKNTEQMRRDAAIAILQQNASLENFKRIIDTTHDGITSLDEDGRVNYWNPAAELIYGYNKEEAAGKKLEELIAVDSRKSDLKQAIMEVYLRGKSVVDMSTQKKRKDGRIIDVLINLFPLKDETGDITGSCMVTKDVSEAKITKDKIREDAHFIGQIADTTPDIIYIMDLNTYQIIYANRQITMELGYSRQQIDMMKNPVLDIVHEDDRPAMMAHLKKMKTLITDDKVLEIEYRMKTAAGNIEWFCDRNTVFKRNSKKIPVEKIGFSQNITARKQQEEQLLTGLDILNQAEELTGMGSWEYDIDTEHFKWSAGMYRLFNLPEHIKPLPEIYFEFTQDSEKDAMLAMVDNIRYNHQSFDETFTLLIPGQEKKTIRIRAVVIKNRKGHPVKIIGVDFDITALVKASEAIYELNKALTAKNRDLESLNGELKTFNIVTSNDYKATLQILYTNLEYIASKDARNLGDASKANIRRAQSAIQKMKLLTEDINTYLQLYDIGINKSMIDPNPILQNVINDMRPKLERANARVEILPLPGMPADPFLFSRLITNIIDNAIKFSKMIHPPVIKIKYSRADEINAIPGALFDTPYIIISISDNGIGFSEEFADKIFDLFFRVYPKGQYKGSGIGLAVCKKIMLMHGGFITGESTPGFGSIFNCYFPDEL